MSTSPRARFVRGNAWSWLLLALVALGLFLAFVSGGINAMFPPPAATAQGQMIRDLYDIVFYIAAAIFFVVEGLILWTVIAYRRRPGDNELPPQTHGNNVAEILWTVIPTVIVAFLFVISWQTLNAVEAVSASPDTHVRAVGGQFQWTFDYLDENGEEILFSQTVPTGEDGGLVVPVGRTVQLQLTSPDVIHSFYVPAFLFKRDVNPGPHANRFDFTVDESFAGQTLHGQCAELCGTGHRIMVFDVHALTGAEYDAWFQMKLEQAQATPAPTDGEPVGTTLDLVAAGISFDLDALEVPAGAPFAIRLSNEDPKGVLHDVDIRTSDGTVLADTQTIDGGTQTAYRYQGLEAGTYTFICSIHPIPQMTGTLTVR